MLCLGTDQILSLWSLQEDRSLDLAFNIRFLSCTCERFIATEAEAFMVFLKLKDGTLRSCYPLGPGGSCLSQHWKYLRKYKVDLVVCHPEVLELVLLASQCGELVLYNTETEQCECLAQMGVQMEAVSFEHKSITNVLALHFKLKSEEQLQRTGKHKAALFLAGTVIIAQTQ